jgi:Uma2 family endonuclease
MVARSQRPAAASYADLERLPATQVGEIVNGTLFAHPRPAARHARAASTLGEELGPPFNRGRGGPGGWIILDEPELHLQDDVLVPDLAGWRRERMPELPDVAAFAIAPDWACEVLSERTAAIDRGEKLPVFARERVAHVWFVDPMAKTLEVLRLDGVTYRILATHYDDALVRAEPFEAFELELAALWAR